MSVRIKYSYIILTVTFFVFVYIVVNRYLQYKTITNVKPIIYSKDLPAITTSICALLQAHRKDYKDFNAELTLNGEHIDTNESYIAGNSICRDLIVQEYDILIEEHYLVQYKTGFQESIGIMKRLKGSYVDNSNVIYPFASIGVPSKIVMYSINLLSWPYDTHCLNYEISQMFCYESCGKSIIQKFEKCRNKCINPTCESLSFHETLIAEEQNNSVYFSKDILTLSSSPELNYSILIQQLIGLVALFFDFAIIDIKSPISNMIKYINKLIKTVYIRKYIRKVRKNIKRLVCMIIVIGSLFHVYASMTIYFQFYTVSETYIGPIFDYSTPNIRVFSRMSESLNVTVKVYGVDIDPLYPTNLKCQLYIPNIIDPDRSSNPIEVVNFKERAILVGFSFKLPVSKLRFDAQTFPNETTYYSSEYSQVTKLPAPYWTNCIEYESLKYNGSEHCYESCLFSFMNFQSSNMYECRDRCLFPECRMMSVYIVKRTRFNLNEQKLIVRRWQSGIKIQTIPQQYLIDFMIYTSTIFGMWLGLSAINLVDLVSYFKFIRFSYCKHFFVFILSIFCCAHIYSVLGSYFKYDIVSKVHIGSPTEYELPIISFYKLGNTGNISVSRKELSPVELMKLSPGTYDVESIQVQNPISRHLQKMDSNTLIKSTSVYYDVLICSISVNEENQHYYKYTGMSDRKFPLIRINADHNYTIKRTAIGIFLRYHVDDPWTVLGIRYKISSIATKLNKIKLLPQPYPTMCIERERRIYKDCALNMHYTIYSKHPNSYWEISSSSNISRMDPDSRIMEKCARKRILYCDSKILETTYGEKEKPSNMIDIQEPRTETSCEIIPKTKFFDVIILIADTIGLWLGISFGLIVAKISKNLGRKKGNQLLVDYTLVNLSGQSNNNTVYPMGTNRLRLIRRNNIVHK